MLVSRRSWFLRLTILCLVVCLLFTALDSVEGKKKKDEKKVSSNGGYSADSDSPSEKDATAAAAASSAEREAAEKALKRKTELERKRLEKKQAAQAASLKQAKARAVQLKQRRQAKFKRDAKAKALAKSRAEALIEKKRNADTPDIRRKGHEKLKWLLKRTAESSSRMINFDTANYHTYISEGPRPYHLMIIYTALSPQHQCHYCHIANQALIPVAQAHFERTKTQTAYVLDSNSTADIPDDGLPVFFANVDMARNSELFKELKFTQAPYMILAPPRLGTKTLKPNDFLRQLPQKYRFNLQASMAPNDFLSFINKLVGIRVDLSDVKPGIFDLLVMLVVLSGIAFVAFKYGFTLLMWAREVQGVRNIALIVGLALYCWCISGGMYNIIRGTQFAETDKEGKITNWIMGDARDQYALEGLAVGVYNLLCATALILINTRAYETTSVGGVKGAKLSPLQHLKNAVSTYLKPELCLIAFCAIWFQVIDIYTRKNWGYRRGLVWR